MPRSLGSIRSTEKNRHRGAGPHPQQHAGERSESQSHPWLQRKFQASQPVKHEILFQKNQYLKEKNHLAPIILIEFPNYCIFSFLWLNTGSGRPGLWLLLPQPLERWICMLPPVLQIFLSIYGYIICTFLFLFQIVFSGLYMDSSIFYPICHCHFFFMVFSYLWSTML